jgi:DedD protein
MDQPLKERLIGATVLVVLVVLVVPALLTGPRSARPTATDTAEVHHEVIDLTRPPGSSQATVAAAPDAPPATTAEPVTPAASPAAGDSAEVPAAPTTPVAPSLPMGKKAVSTQTPVPNPAPSAPIAAQSTSTPAPSVADKLPLPSAGSRVATQAAVDSPASTGKNGRTENAASGPPAAVSGPVSAPVVAPEPKPHPVTPTPKAEAKPATVSAGLAEAKVPPKTPSAAAPKVPAPTEPAPTPKAAPKASPVDSTGGWVVQLGSFAAKENAEKLARDLKAKKFKAFVSEFRGSGKVLWRVRVGPEQDRSRIDRIAERLQAEGHKGTVAPAN